MYNEYDAKIKSIAKTFIDARQNDVQGFYSMLYTVLTLLSSKGLFSQEDLELVFDVENVQVQHSATEYFNVNQGDKSCIIANEKELEYVISEIFNMFEVQKASIINSSKEVNKQDEEPDSFVTKKELLSIIKEMTGKKKPAKKLENEKETQGPGNS